MPIPITLQPGQIAVPTDLLGNLILLKNVPPTVSVAKIGVSTYELTISLCFTPTHENSSPNPVTINNGDFFVCNIGDINKNPDSKKVLVNAHNDQSGTAFLDTTVILTTGVKTDHG